MQQASQPSIINFLITTQPDSTPTLLGFPISILEFKIQILNNNHNQPYPIPKQICSSTYPFQIIRQFLQAHSYNPQTIIIKKPINSNVFKDLVDQKTFNVVQRFVNKENAKLAMELIDLCRFLRFHQLHDAVCAAIATHYYIKPNDAKQLNEFNKIHNIDDISPYQIDQIIKQYSDVFDIIQAKFKQEFAKKQMQINQ